MEVSINDYAKMMFEMMLKNKKDIPSHWKKVYDDAKPLVQQLLDMKKDLGYEVYGVGLKKSNTQRILEAQDRCWGCEARTLKEGDKVWLRDESEDMYVGQNDPCSVFEVTNRGVYIKLSRLNYEIIQYFSPTIRVLKAPDNFSENYEQYESDKYWLKMADTLGI